MLGANQVVQVMQAMLRRLLILRMKIIVIIECVFSFVQFFCVCVCVNQNRTASQFFSVYVLIYTGEHVQLLPVSVTIFYAWCVII